MRQMAVNKKQKPVMANNESEFTDLAKQHKSLIYMVCYMFSKDEVNDLFQETLINMWKGYEAFRQDSKASTWIYRVALNTCVSQERKKKKHPVSSPLQMDVNLFEDDDIDTQQLRQLHERIQRLGLVDRAIVMMWLEGLTYDEMAAVIGITPQNVGVKLFRIKESLKKMK